MSEISANLSIVIPARNEDATLKVLLSDLQSMLPEAQIIAVNDGSDDATEQVITDAGVLAVHHPVSLGNGAAIKAGARLADRKFLAFMDADGQHSAASLVQIYKRLLADARYAMIVGARSAGDHANTARLGANTLYNTLATMVTGQRIADLTSGLRVTRRADFIPFLSLLPNGFSYPTTITMAYLRSGLPVGFEKVVVHGRSGRSHIRPLRDGLRFLLIIFKVGTLYAPLKIYAPISAVFGLSGMGLYAWTYLTTNRFTNMSALLFSVATLIFVLGLLSEQITQLTYLALRRGHDKDDGSQDQQ